MLHAVVPIRVQLAARLLRATDALRLRERNRVLPVLSQHFLAGMGKRYDLGFDGFFINKKWLHIFPQSILCLGQCFWDFWVPYQSILAGVPAKVIKER